MKFIISKIAYSSRFSAAAPCSVAQDGGVVPFTFRDYIGK